MGTDKRADLQKLDAKGISAEALKALLSGKMQEAFSTPGLVALTATRAERRRRLNNAIKDPMGSLPKQKTKGGGGAMEQTIPQGMQMMPMAPGMPVVPSNVSGIFSPEQMMAAQQVAQQPGAAPKMASLVSVLRDFIKRAGSEEGTADIARPFPGARKLLSYLTTQ